MNIWNIKNNFTEFDNLKFGMKRHHLLRLLKFRGYEPVKDPSPMDVEDTNPHDYFEDFYVGYDEHDRMNYIVFYPSSILMVNDDCILPGSIDYIKQYMNDLEKDESDLYISKRYNCIIGPDLTNGTICSISFSADKLEEKAS